jgi:hypothetical protein
VVINNFGGAVPIIMTCNVADVIAIVIRLIRSVYVRYSAAICYGADVACKPHAKSC